MKEESIDKKNWAKNSTFLAIGIFTIVRKKLLRKESIGLSFTRTIGRHLSDTMIYLSEPYMIIDVIKLRISSLCKMIITLMVSGMIRKYAMRYEFKAIQQCVVLFCHKVSVEWVVNLWWTDVRTLESLLRSKGGLEAKGKPMVDYNAKLLSVWCQGQSFAIASVKSLLFY